MKEFNEALSDFVLIQGSFDGIKEARETLDNLIKIYNQQGVALFFEALSRLDIMGDSLDYYTAWAALRLLGWEEHLPWVTISPRRLKEFCQSFLEELC